MKKFFYKTSLISGLNFSIINGMNNDNIGSKNSDEKLPLNTNNDTNNNINNANNTTNNNISNNNIINNNTINNNINKNGTNIININNKVFNSQNEDFIKTNNVINLLNKKRLDKEKNTNDFTINVDNSNNNFINSNNKKNLEINNISKLINLNESDEENTLNVEDKILIKVGEIGNIINLNKSDEKNVYNSGYYKISKLVNTKNLIHIIKSGFGEKEYEEFINHYFEKSEKIKYVFSKLQVISRKYYKISNKEDYELNLTRLLTTSIDTLVNFFTKLDQSKSIASINDIKKLLFEENFNLNKESLLKILKKNITGNFTINDCYLLIFIRNMIRYKKNITEKFYSENKELLKLDLVPYIDLLDLTDVEITDSPYKIISKKAQEISKNSDKDVLNSFKEGYTIKDIKGIEESCCIYKYAIDDNIEKTLLYSDFIEFKKEMRKIYYDFLKSFYISFNTEEKFEKISKEEQNKYLNFFYHIHFFLYIWNNFKYTSYYNNKEYIKGLCKELYDNGYNDEIKEKIKNFYVNIIEKEKSKESVDIKFFLETFFEFNNGRIEVGTPANCNGFKKSYSNIIKDYNYFYDEKGNLIYDENGDLIYDENGD